MITQFRLNLQTDGRELSRDDAYPLYAMLLEGLDHKQVAELHESERSPLSQYLLPVAGGAV